MEKPPLTFRDVYDRLTLHVAASPDPVLRKLLFDMEDSFPADVQKSERAAQYARDNIDLTADEAMDLRPWVRPQDALAFCRRMWVDVRTDISRNTPRTLRQAPPTGTLPRIRPPISPPRSPLHRDRAPIGSGPRHLTTAKTGKPSPFHCDDEPENPSQAEPIGYRDSRILSHRRHGCKLAHYRFGRRPDLTACRLRLGFTCCANLA